MSRGVVAVGVFVATVGSLGCGSTRTTATVTKTVTVTRAGERASGRPREAVFYGTVKSLRRQGGRFELRFDPAWFLSGSAAERAAVDDGILKPGEPVPNDNYVVDETDRLLTYAVSPQARVTVVTRGPTTTLISVAELAQILKGRNPKHRPLFVPGNHLGFWIRVSDKYPNPVVALDQQYRP